MRSTAASGVCLLLSFTTFTAEDDEIAERLFDSLHDFLWQFLTLDDGFGIVRSGCDWVVDKGFTIRDVNEKVVYDRDEEVS